MVPLFAQDPLFGLNSGSWGSTIPGGSGDLSESLLATSRSAMPQLFTSDHLRDALGSIDFSILDEQPTALFDETVVTDTNTSLRTSKSTLPRQNSPVSPNCAPEPLRLAGMKRSEPESTSATYSESNGPQSVSPTSSKALSLRGKKIITTPDGRTKVVRDRSDEEHGRRRRMNDFYNALRELVPVGNKTHKEGVLEDTVTYLRNLREDGLQQTNFSTLPKRVEQLPYTNVTHSPQGRVIASIACEDVFGVFSEIASLVSSMQLHVCELHVSSENGVLRVEYDILPRQSLDIVRLRQSLHALVTFRTQRREVPLPMPEVMTACNPTFSTASTPNVRDDSNLKNPRQRRRMM